MRLSWVVTGFIVEVRADCFGAFVVRLIDRRADFVRGLLTKFRGQMFVQLIDHAEIHLLIRQGSVVGQIFH